ncbi:hypothetical protein [Cellulomonas sp. 73-145]|uniref:hypothetical protein n=1 Tax=Cellulomonas sp. 73-145 TaxID=1895739 RepID=UPI001AC8CE1F|nr:hypothetical protein [Cellulomonas sp. 73-145]MBN9325834.1 hypothetical protein [Cellulomonas sp.]
MSTSDPQDRPAPTEPVAPAPDAADAGAAAGTTPTRPAGSAPTSEPRPVPGTAPGSEPAAAHESAAPADLPPSGEGLTVSDETAHRHAQARPLPTPPDPEAADRRLPPPRFTAARSERQEPTPDSRTTTALPAAGAPGSGPARDVPPAPMPGPAVAAGAVAGEPGSAGRPGERTGAPPLATPATVASTPGTAEDGTLFPDPNAPRTIGAGTHVLGLIVGLLLPAVAAVVTLLGVSRILSVEADGWVARVEVLGIVLVALGALLLAAVALLSLWTPWVGYTGGVLLTLAGALALFAPGVSRNAMLQVVSAEGWQPTVVQTSVAATSGTLLVIGVMVLASGIVSHVARRHGIHLGAFRERNAH